MMEANPVKLLLKASLTVLLPMTALAQPATTTEPRSSGPARAVASAPEAENANPALAYARAWLMTDKETFRRILEHAANDPRVQPDEVVADLRSAGDEIERLIEATQTPGSADFGIDYAKGPQALLPHLAKMRETTRVLAADANRLMSEGDLDAASVRIAANFDAARHCRNDRVLISSLVSAAIAKLAVRDANRLLELPGASPESLRRVAESIDRLDGEDPFGVRRSITGESEIFLHWLREKAAEPEGRIAVMREVASLVGEGPERAQEWDRIARLPDDQFMAEFDRAERYYVDALAAWDAPDAEARIAGIVATLENGGYGEIAKLVAPSLGRIHRTEGEAVGEVRSLRERIGERVPHINERAG